MIFHVDKPHKFDLLILSSKMSFNGANVDISTNLDEPALVVKLLSSLYWSFLVCNLLGGTMALLEKFHQQILFDSCYAKDAFIH